MRNEGVQVGQKKVKWEAADGGIAAAEAAGRIHFRKAADEKKKVRDEEVGERDEEEEEEVIDLMRVEDEELEAAKVGMWLRRRVTEEDWNRLVAKAEEEEEQDGNRKVVVKKERAEATTELDRYGRSMSKVLGGPNKVAAKAS